MNVCYFYRKLNFSDASPDGQRSGEDISVGGMGAIPGSPAMSSCSEGEPPQSPIESYLSASGRSRSPIISSSMPPHAPTTQSDVDSLRLLLQEVICFFSIRTKNNSKERVRYVVYYMYFYFVCRIPLLNYV